ncbi:MAG: class I SAM-dependent methyltransferase [Ferruginibacter sp.]
MQEKYHLTVDKKIADIGAGTGISAELFLKAGYEVIAVEPNKEMREKSITLLNKFEKFNTVDGTAENSSLQDKSVDAIIAGQAFHWFNVTKTKKRNLKEF